MSENPGEHNPKADYTARGIASEVTQALRSHERMDELQFAQMQKQHEEIKTVVSEAESRLVTHIDEVRQEMRDGFKAYDNKFWSLALVTISLLLTIAGMLLYKILFPNV